MLVIADPDLETTALDVERLVAVVVHMQRRSAVRCRPRHFSGASAVMFGTLAGVGFTSNSSVKFNGVAASAVTFVSATKLTAKVPPTATDGPITVTYTTAPIGTVRSANSYNVT